MKMKKLLSVILAAVMLLGCMSIPAFAADPAVLNGFSGGDGSEGNPYQIATVGELENLAEIVNNNNDCADTYFVLTADIEGFGGIIGYKDDDTDAPFCGHFDGKNHTVTLSVTDESCFTDLPELANFFFKNRGTIANLNIAGCECVYTGICSYNYGTISNCCSSVEKNSDSGYISGICLSNHGTIINCCFLGSIHAKDRVTGICYFNKGTIINCFNSGTLGAEFSKVSGICYDNDGIINNCYNLGSIDAVAEVSGICVTNKGTMINCYNAGRIIDSTGNFTNSVSGLCMENSNGGTITNCYYDNTLDRNPYDMPDYVVLIEDQYAAALTTAQIKGAAGTPDALVDKLNGYTDTETGKYPEGWKTWVIGADGYPTFESEPEDDFLTSFTLNKDYNDKYITDAKTTKVNETVTFTITPITANAPEFDPDTFSMTVTDGAGSADVDLPGTDDIDSVGDYWYKIEETAGTTAGVDYDDTTYYLHLIVSYKDGEFGFSAAAIHTTENGEGDDDTKITLVSNSYGEGTLTVGQVTTVNGEDSSEDTFTAEVTFTAPTGTTVTGEIKYGDLTIDPEDWANGSVTVEIELKGGDTVTFEHIPDGVTYTVEQTGKNEDKGYQLDDVAFDNDDEDGDTVTDLVASGTIGDAADTVTITNSKTIPIDVGVILENSAFIVLALGALAVGAWLIISKRRKSVDAE